VKACPGFDDRFDGLWEDLKRNNPHLLLGVRTREVLDWHFKNAALHNRLSIITVVDGPRLAAYAIFDRRDSPRYCLRRMRLVDFQSRDGSTVLLAPMIAWALNKYRDEGLHLLEITGSWLEKGELLEAAPYWRHLATWTYFYRANNPKLAEELKDRRSWSPSLLDGDASL
jgi:hypothetical protein